MERKQCGHHEAAPAVARRAVQNPEQQHRVYSVQQNVDVVVAGRIELKQVNVNGMGEPGDRMPVSQVVGCECPSDHLAGRRFKTGVVFHVLLIVHGEKRMMMGGRINDHRQQGKQ